MIHPDTELRFINPEVGFGVVATRRIPRGVITWVRDSLDQVLTAQQVEQLTPLHMRDLLKHSYFDRQGRYILCWDIARYTNHSCDTNTGFPGFVADDFEIAVRDIEPGEQIFGDYATYNRDGGFACFCQASRCRHIIDRNDREQLADRLDELVRQAIGQVFAVPQPLWSLISAPADVELAVRDPRQSPSCRAQFFERSF